MIYIIAFATGFFTRCFHLAVQFSRYKNEEFVSSFSFQFSVSRSLKTIQFKEDQTIIRPLSSCFVDFSALRLLQSFDCQQTQFLKFVSTWNERSDFSSRSLPRKEVIQPHLPIRLPCYDFTPVIGLTFDGWLLSVTSPASGAPNSHGVTGGVYKARERIHRGMLIRDY